MYALLYTLPGIPSVYYGSEFGIEGRKQGPNDDPLRPQINLDEIKRQNPNEKLTQWIAALGKIRKENTELSRGAYRELLLTNRQYAFARILDGRAVITAVNNDEQDAEMCIPLPFAVKECIELVSGERGKIENGKLCARLKACESALWKITQGN